MKSVNDKVGSVVNCIDFIYDDTNAEIRRIINRNMSAPLCSLFAAVVSRVERTAKK